MDRVKQHFEEEAQDFDRLILTLIPSYREMIEALVAAIPFPVAAPIDAMDLGCGTGTVAKAVLHRFPNARITCVDVAKNMIDIAKAKLAAYPRAGYAIGDFNTFMFDNRYDAVVSSLALHHLATDADKRHFFRKIYDALNSGGVFYNADIVFASNAHLQQLYMQQWRAFMLRSLTQDEVEDKWIPKHYSEDHPAKLTDQLRWLTEIGFTDVDVLWKTYNSAVYGGVRQQCSGNGPC